MPEAFRFLPTIADAPVLLDAPERGTLAEAVAVALPALAKGQRSCVRVTHCGAVVPAHLWPLVRPKVWEAVRVEVRPGADLLRTLLLVAVSAAALAASAGLATPLLGAVGIASSFSVFGATISTGAILGGVIAIGGTLLINALVPPAKADKDNKTPTYAINGFQNQPAPNQPIPAVLGFPRIALQFGTLPRWLIVGDDEWTQVQALAGYGPLDLSDDRIGRTPLGKFVGATPEYRSGLSTDTPLTFGAPQCLEDRENPTDVRATDTPPPSRFTARDASGAEIEFFFPSGLYRLDAKGKKNDTAVDIQIRWRKVGTSTWASKVLQIWSPILSNRDRPFYRADTLSWTDRGEYEIEVTRITLDVDDLEAFTGDQKYFTRFTWVSTRSFRPEYPTNYPVPVAQIGLQLKATGQLSGTVSQYNVLAKSILPDWDYATQTWITRATNNPAALARYAQQGPFCPNPRPDSDFDLPAFQDWHDFCRLNGLGYNYHHTEVELADDARAHIYAAGRAIQVDVDGKISVAIDRTQTEFWDHISPRNSWGFSVKDDPNIYPDAIRATFRDETNLHQQSEALVPWPGFTGDPVVTEDWSDLFRGVTNPDQIRIAIRRRQLEAIYRSRSFQVSQDFEHLAADIPMRAVYLNHFVLDRRQYAGRVRSVVGRVVVIDELVTMEAGLSYGIRFRLADGRSIISPVPTWAGEARSFTVDLADADMPAAGDLAMFGVLGSETIEAIVKEVKRGPNQSGTLTLVDHAPEIDEQLALYTPPPWDSRAGHEVSLPATVPAVPIIAGVASGLATSTTSAAPSVVVTLQPGSSTPAVSSYAVDHRLSGAFTWTTITVLSGTGAATITGYATGDLIEVRVRAMNGAGASASTAVRQFRLATVHVDQSKPTVDSTRVTVDAA